MMHRERLHPQFAALPASAPLTLRWILATLLVGLASSILTAGALALVARKGAAQLAQPWPDHPAGAFLSPASAPDDLASLYETTSSGIVHVTVQRMGRVGNGSGFVVSPDGEILTNSHVVRASEAITVVLDDGDAFAATVVGLDPTTDLALLKVKPAPVRALHVLPLGDSNLVRVGEPAIVIGSPFGFEQSLSAGYVSAIGRSIRSDDAFGAEIDGVLQTDAAVNPGNSGGPLLNRRGEVIGVASAIYSTGQGFEGIGFAVPVNLVKGVLPQLREQGFVTRPYLGVRGMDITPAHAGGLKLSSKKGVLVQTVEEGSAADLAGLKGGQRMRKTPFGAVAVGGDILLAIDDAPVDSLAEISRVVHQHMVGESVSLTVLREGRRMELRGRLSAQPVPAGLGVKVASKAEPMGDVASGLEIQR